MTVSWCDGDDRSLQQLVQLPCKAALHPKLYACTTAQLFQLRDAQVRATKPARLAISDRCREGDRSQYTSSCGRSAREATAVV